MKKKVLIVFKYPHRWNNQVIKKFSNYYDTENLYISDLKNINFKEVINKINNLIKSKNIEIVVFDPDYFKFINLFFIQKIKAKKKIIWTGDDFELHSMNAITASECDLILSTCPLSVLKYKEKGYQAYLTHGEKGEIINNSQIKKEIDVLFFGALTEDRELFLNYITSKGINLKNVGHKEGMSGLPSEELQKLISKSKIILNLSKTRTTSVKNFSSESIYKFYYQSKGRITIAGINGIACVSEYSPVQDMLFKNKEIPTFYTKEECVDVLKSLLKNEELLKKVTRSFTERANELYEDKKSFELIYEAIEKSNGSRVQLIKIPYWYLRISAKQIILRNVNLFNLFTSLLQLNLILELLKNSNLIIKFLILSESLVNIIWYSLALTLKKKTNAK